MSQRKNSSENAGYPTPFNFYDRWEKHHWRIGDLSLEQDRGDWKSLSPFTKEELRTGAIRFFLGELSVTARTLGPLAEAAPHPEDQLFLCTQVADEARHSLFFYQYLNSVVLEETITLGDCAKTSWRDAPNTFSRFFDSELQRVTQKVRDNPGSPADWYVAVATYHGIGEGVLAMTYLRSMRRMLKSIRKLPALAEGLRNVARDESRHVSFGLSALRDGVDVGYGRDIGDTFLRLIEMAVNVLVNPERAQMLGIIPAAMELRGRSLLTQWQDAQQLLLRHLSKIGLKDLIASANRLWITELSKSVKQYESLHGRPHPAWRLIEAQIGTNGEAKTKSSNQPNSR